MLKRLSPLIALLILGYLWSFPSCSSPPSTILWVAGYQAHCAADGAEKRQCLQVYWGEELEDAEWELLYADIEGFRFVEGVLQKIAVHQQESPSEDVPADASTLQYTLIEVLAQEPDPRAALAGSWQLADVQPPEILQANRPPTLTIDLATMKISGDGSCNRYYGEIQDLSFEAIAFTQLSSTKKMCPNIELEYRYFGALKETSNYLVTASQLMLYREDGSLLLTYTKEGQR